MELKILLLSVLVLTLLSLVLAEESLSWKELTDQAFDFYKKGEYKKAVLFTRKALEIAEQQFGPESLQVAESTGNLAALYDIQGKTTKAKNLFDKARVIRAKHGVTGIPLGLQSEVFFDKLAKAKAIAVERAKKKGEHPVQQKWEEVTSAAPK